MRFVFFVCSAAGLPETRLEVIIVVIKFEFWQYEYAFVNRPALSDVQTEQHWTHAYTYTGDIRRSGTWNAT